MGDRLYKKGGGDVWYGYYYAADGTRHCVCTKQQDRAAARAVLRQLEREAQTALGPSKGKATGYTVGVALEDFLDHGCINVAPKTEEMYRQKAGHLLRLLGEHGSLEAPALGPLLDAVRARFGDERAEPIAA